MAIRCGCASVLQVRAAVFDVRLNFENGGPWKIDIN